MGHRIKVLRNFIEPADAEKLIRLIEAGPQVSFVDTPAQQVRVLPNTNTTAEWMLKKYSDRLIDEHREEFGWKPHLFTTKAQAFALYKGADVTDHVDLVNGQDHIITSSLIYLGGDFTGGKIVFINQEFEFEPEPLSAVIFPSGSWEYQYISEPVTSGSRYTVAMWHTGSYQESLQQKYLREHNILLSNLWSANYKAGVCGI